MPALNKALNGVILGAVLGVALLQGCGGREPSPTVTCVWTRDMRRNFSIGSVAAWLSTYRHNLGAYPYSPRGSDAALELLIRAPYYDAEDAVLVSSTLRSLEPEAACESADSFVYLYLNPEPPGRLTDETIMLVERDFYYGDRSLCVATADTLPHLLWSVAQRPEDLLGRPLSEVVVTEHEPVRANP